MNSLKNELSLLFSGPSMPYVKVSVLVSIVCAVLFTLCLGNNTIHEGPVAVIDMDNSAYSRQIIDKIDASPFIRVRGILHTAVDPRTLLYGDRCIAVVYLPPQLEKNRYASHTGTIGVLYDNTSTAQSADMKSALNEIIAAENAQITGASLTRAETGLSLRDRLLFNPSGSNANNGNVQGFLIFFSSMFFVFATIGMIPRLRQTGQLQKIMRDGTPWDILIRLLPYGTCLFSGLLIGMVLLHYVNDMVFSGSILLFYMTQGLYIFVLGTLSLLFGWTAANPGAASSRMILLIPGGFILGGTTAPFQKLSEWVQIGSHIFPLAWEFEFTRNIVIRGAGFWDIATTMGAFFLYTACITLVFHAWFYYQKRKLLETEAICKKSP